MKWFSVMFWWTCVSVWVRRSNPTRYLGILSIHHFVSTYRLNNFVLGTTRKLQRATEWLTDAEMRERATLQTPDCVLSVSSFHTIISCKCDFHHEKVDAWRESIKVLIGWVCSSVCRVILTEIIWLHSAECSYIFFGKCFLVVGYSTWYLFLKTWSSGSQHASSDDTTVNCHMITGDCNSCLSSTWSLTTNVLSLCADSWSTTFDLSSVDALTGSGSGSDVLFPSGVMMMSYSDAVFLSAASFTAFLQWARGVE